MTHNTGSDKKSTLDIDPLNSIGLYVVNVGSYILIKNVQQRHSNGGRIQLWRVKIVVYASEFLKFWFQIGDHNSETGKHFVGIVDL